jgi:galactokinase
MRDGRDSKRGHVAGGQSAGLDSNGQDSTGRGESRILENLRCAFESKYGTMPRIFFAPGRVNLLGAHLDYNGGKVLPVALGRGTYVALAQSERPTSRFASLDLPGEFEMEPGEEIASELLGWAAYPVGVWLELGDRCPGPFDFLVAGNLPRGGGLSSSASLSVATAFGLLSLGGNGVDPEEVANLAWAAETSFVGVQCGIMDQYASAISEQGRVLLLDCHVREYELLPFAEDLELVVLDTRKPRTLVTSAFNQRVDECHRALDVLKIESPDLPVLAHAQTAEVEAAAEALGPVLSKRARHVVEESARMEQVRAVLEADDHAALGALVRASHDSCRELYEVSCAELDFLVEGVCAFDGVHGARLTGAGFGGCVVALVEPGCFRAEEEASLLQAYAECFGFEAAVLRLELGNEVREIQL